MFEGDGPRTTAFDSLPFCKTEDSINVMQVKIIKKTAKAGFVFVGKVQVTAAFCLPRAQAERQISS